MAKATKTECFLDGTRKQLIELLGCIDEAWDVCGRDRSWARDDEVEAMAEQMFTDVAAPVNEAVAEWHEFAKLKKAGRRAERIFDALASV